MKVVIDTETGGLQAGINPVLEIAIIPCSDRWLPEPEKAFHTLVRPTDEMMEHIDRRALIVNGRLNEGASDADYAEAIEKIKEYPDRVSTIKAFAAWYASMGGKQLTTLGHNWRFDYEMLEHSWMNVNRKKGASINSFFFYQAHDSQTTAQWMLEHAKVHGTADSLPFKSVSLAKLTEALGIPHSEKHSAMGDATATALLYRRLLNIMD